MLKEELGGLRLTIAGSDVSTGVVDNKSAQQANPAVLNALRDTMCVAFDLAYQGKADRHPPTHHADPARARAIYALLTMALICSSDKIA